MWHDEVTPEDAETIAYCCFLFLFFLVCKVVHFSEQSKSSSGKEEEHLVTSLPVNLWTDSSWLIRVTAHAVVPSLLLAIKALTKYAFFFTYYSILSCSLLLPIVLNQVTYYSQLWLVKLQFCLQN